MIFSLFTFFLLSFFTTLQPQEICLSENEMRLYDRINEVRIENGLDGIPLSQSLTEVARLHAEDLSSNEPYDERICNMHSWSGQGAWKKCCYRSDHSNADCMWEKPSELTDYEADGFEIVAYWQTSDRPEKEIAPDTALEMWLSSPGHRSVVLNKMSFSKVRWNAVGVAIYGNFSSVWFGMEKDENPSPAVCVD